jgi:small-conductance mechanosensitive channel
MSALATTTTLQAQQQLQNIPSFLQETIATILLFLPRLVGALLILLVGWVIGRVVARVVRTLTDKIELDRMTLRTPLGRILGGSEAAVSRAFGKLAAYYVYFLAILAAANVLAIPMLSQWIDTAVTYLPSFIAGLLIIVIGFVLADFIGEMVERTMTATQSAYNVVFADGARVFLYFIAMVIGLETMGVGVEILYIFAGGAALGLAAAIGLGIGLSVGLGSSEYVSDNVDRWVNRASDSPAMPGGQATDGGVDADAE